MFKPTLLFVALTLTLQAQAQQQPPETQHYPAGIQGLKSCSLPPEGLFLIDYNYLYTATKFNNLPADFSVTAYVQAPRILWLTEVKSLGISYGMDTLIPIPYATVKINGNRMTKFGIGDVAFEPVLVTKHLEHFDLAAGYAFTTPTGDFDPHNPASPGKGFWSHMFTLGCTWYPDEAKTYSISLLNRYEIAHEQDKTGITPGQQDTLELGISKALSKTVDVGLVGYYQGQTTGDSGSRSSNLRDQVFALGPEISAVVPSLGVIASLRYNHEFAALNRPEGNTICLTVIKGF